MAIYIIMCHRRGVVPNRDQTYRISCMLRLTWVDGCRVGVHLWHHSEKVDDRQQLELIREGTLRSKDKE